MTEARMHALPPRLGRLKEASRDWGFFAGNFEWEQDGAASAMAWFAGRAELAAKFAVFGHEGTGGLYAFWPHDDLPVAEAPIAYLGSEGEARVLASNVAEFLSLLALDVNDLGMFDDLSAQEPANSEGHVFYLAWLEKEGLSLPDNPERIVEAARRAHPGLAASIGRAEAARIEAPRRMAKPATELPDDPIDLLNKPRPAAQIPDDGGLELEVSDDGLVTTVFLRNDGELGRKLRPGAMELMGMSRSHVASKLGKPTRTAKSGGWERFNRGDVCIHVSYDGKPEAVDAVTLMWLPAMPEHLR